ncbi:aldehyde dehydrogenase (NADP(+)) [Amycolatopsis endophytica]|uniref:NADP-dependent aldehyde dehydrogenase n=1 Tax=Amycolatopsis endophytica TaxID=860233 RepID=A0A853B5K8_9PSEU|nr:aldehyde dehydrogenase (NADP(+)) [Amycolatopsis endophytica]NYI90095.1 NADP-dependent aldehyde dehydrogenase [Amycolatopsis endophytica]
MTRGIDPRTGATVGPEIPDTTPAQVRAACSRAAQAAPWLAGLPFAERAELLAALGRALREHQDELCALADAETALGSPRLTGELARTAAQLDLFAEVLRDGAFCEATLDSPDPDAVPPHTDLRRMLVPLGPVAVFAASNFPFAFSVAGGDTASALAAGCPVVVKAHPGHPGLSVRTAEILTEALAAAGAPDGVLTLVHGEQAGRALVADPAVTAVGFTGSPGGGRALFDVAMSRPDPIPFYGELGSINPVVVTAAAAAARSGEIAEGLAGSAMLGSGQFCTKPGLVFVPSAAGLPQRVADKVAEATVTPLLTARIATGYREGLDRMLEVPGVRALLDGQASAADGHQVAAQVVTVDAQAFMANAAVLTEECFGPVTVVVSYSAPDELAAALALVPGALTGTLHAEPEDPDAAPAATALAARVGRLIHNGWPTGVAVTWSQHHGGPSPATTAVLHTSVGATAIRRFLRPLTYQDVPGHLLPAALRDGNPLGIPRRVDGKLTLGGVAGRGGTP